MEALNILQDAASLRLDYDQEADVLYIGSDPARPALGVDIGDGVILRYDEPHREVVGITIVGLKERLSRGLDNVPGLPAAPAA